MKEVIISFFIIFAFIVYIFIVSPPSFSQEAIFTQQYSMITLVLNKLKAVTVYFDSQQITVQQSMTIEVTTPTITIASSSPFTVNGIKAVYNPTISAYSVSLQVEDYETLNINFEN